MLLEIFEKIIVVLINLLSSWLAFWVHIRVKKGKIKQWFWIISLLILLWVDFAYLGFHSKKVFTAIFWYKLNFGAVSLFFFSSYYFFVIHFLKKRAKKIEKLVLLGSFLFFFLSTSTNLIIGNVVIRKWGAEIIYGKLGNTFSLFALFIAFIILYYLFKSYFIFSKTKRLKVQYFFLGITLYITLNIIFNVFTPLLLKTVQYSRFADYSAIFLLFFTALAIVKRKLFGIKVILVEVLVSSMGVILAILPFLMPDNTLKALTAVILLLFVIFSIYLIKAVREEEKRRKDLEKIAREERHLRKKAESLATRWKRLKGIEDQFMKSTQHYLRTPMSALIGFSENLTEELNKKKLSKKELSHTARQLSTLANRLNKEINELLDVSQFRMKKAFSFIKEITLKEIIQIINNEISLLKPEAKKKGLYIKLKSELKKAELDLKTKIDSNRFRYAINTLIDNGVKHTKTGGLTISLKINKKGIKLKRKKTFLISVEDTGIGILKKELKNIGAFPFERGYLAKKLSPLGRGIGLYLSKKAVEELFHGKLWAESSGLDKGSIFYIELPIF